jgi:hypothetical protein
LEVGIDQNNNVTFREIKARSDCSLVAEIAQEINDSNARIGGRK